LLSFPIAGFAFFCFVVSASALDSTRTVSQYLRDSWGVEKGLPGGTVTAIAQTSDGYLWIGTDRGLFRFDGLAFYQFERALSDPFRIGPVRALLVDASDDLWISLQNSQLFRYHNGKVELIRGDIESGTTTIAREASGAALLSSTAMARGTSGAILLSSSDSGTLTYSDNRFRRLSAAVLPADDGRVANSEVPDQGATPFSWFDHLAALTSVVISMVQTEDGKIWLGTERRGLFYLQEGRVSSAVNGRRDVTKITCFLPFHNSELWIGTAKGVLRWNGTELTVVGIPSSLRNLDVLSFLRDRDSNIWVGTSRGLFRYNAKGVSLLSTTGRVTALFEDRERNIWIGSTRGLERLRDSPFVTYSLPNLKSQSMGPLHADSGGRTWVAPIQGGLRWLKEGQSGVVTVDRIGNDVVYSITGIGKNDIWVGRQQGGLTHLRYSGNSLTAKTYTQADGLPVNSVYAVYQSRDGSVWSATLNRGISELKNGRFTNYTTAEGLAANTISSIAEGADGTMWFGTPNGISAMSQKGARTYSGKDGLPSEDVNCLLQDSTRILWIGTAEGLAYLRDGQVHVPREVPGVLQAPILGIEEDIMGWLWIATSDHVLRVPRDKMLNGVVKALDVREYDQADGLQSTEGVKRSRSVVSDSAGRIWFSLGSGLSVVNPSQIEDESVPALPHIEAITADDNTLKFAASVRIPPSPRRITFEYTGLSLASPEQIRFRYFLENFDKGWSQPVAAREAVYTNLGPGSYRFRLVASKSEGLWNGPETAIALNVAPAYYQTYWFRALCVLAFLALLWMLYQLRLRQLQRQFDIGLEARVNERSRIARDLHDTLLQDLHGLMFQFQAARNLMTRRPDEAMRSLDEAIGDTKKALAESRDAIQGLRSEMIQDGNLAGFLAASSREQVNLDSPDDHLPDFELIEEGARKLLSANNRNEICRIGLEILRNAYRHAHARRIEVEIRYGDQLLRLRIRDDGKGIDPEVLKEGGSPGHWGLRGVRERAERIGARVDFWSEAGAGTEFQLAVPADIAYETSADGVGPRFFRKVRNRAHAESNSDPDRR
jgi:ligand-binding sensor domain-containing protein/signal transduction histidine kinase